jgi:hypothetical protein
MKTTSNKIFKIISFYIFLFVSFSTYCQSSYVHISNERIYDFLDELASLKLITLNSAIKPYTRTYVYMKLQEAEKQAASLNHRQSNELEYYLDYYKFGNESNYLPQKSAWNLFKKHNNISTSINHIGLFYSDSLFNFSLRPILGIEYFTNSSGSYTHTYRGAEAFASVGKHLSMYVDLRDNTISEQLVQPTFFTRDMGGAYKENTNDAGSSDFSEVRGGIVFSNRFMDLGIVKDHLVWGDNNNGSNILSGRTPSFAMIKFHLNPVKWFDFNYFHAWLVSEVIDSSLRYVLSNGRIRDTYRNKYMAANMYTIIPVRGLNLSFGNSIIYSDMSVNAAYLIPFLFYKSVDHTVNHGTENQNSQMFFNISSRLIQHTHIYGSLYFDDFSANRVTDPQTHNFYSFKIGGQLNDWPLNNLGFILEYFKSVPITYKHYIPTLTYESNKYNLGPYLRDNSEEIFFSVNFKPLPRFYTRYSYTNARHGNEYNYINGIIDVTYPILKDNTWTSISHSLVCSYEILTNCHITLEYLISDTKGYDVDGQSAEYYLNRFTPAFFQGNKNTFMVRLNIGF